MLGETPDHRQKQAFKELASLDELRILHKDHKRIVLEREIRRRRRQRETQGQLQLQLGIKFDEPDT